MMPATAVRPRSSPDGETGVARRGPALATVLAAILLPVSLAGQGAGGEYGEIRGRVVDLARNAPVPAARVTIPRLDRTTLAGPDGRFRFRDVPPGTHPVRVEFLGYRSNVGEVEVRPGETHRVEIRITPGPVQIEDLDVSVRSLTWLPGFRQRRENRTGHFFVKHEIEEADPDHLADLLRDAEGVRIGFNRNAHGPSKFYPQFYDRCPGAGLSCRPPVFVDGEMIGPGRRYWHFNEIPAERVLAMEVYYREQDVPEAIEYDHRGRLTPDGGDAELAAPATGGGVGAGRGSGPGVREILAAAGAGGLFDRQVPERDEELDLGGTVVAGLYDQSPRLEHCGAIFVWTRLYPYRER